MAIQTLPAHLSPHAPRRPCCEMSSGMLVVTPPSLDRRASCKAQACFSGTFISGISGVKVTLAFNLVKKSCPSNATGHFGIYKKKLCFRLGASVWQSGDCKNSFWRGFLDNPLVKVLFWANSLGPTPCESSVQNRASGSTTSQRGNLFPTKGLPRAPDGKLFPQAESPQRILCHSLVSSMNNAFSSSSSFFCKLRQTFFQLPSCLKVRTAANPLLHVPLVGFFLWVTLHSLGSLGLTLCSNFCLPFLHRVSLPKGTFAASFHGSLFHLVFPPNCKTLKAVSTKWHNNRPKSPLFSATGAL